jgi:hypothetical protein
VIDLELVDRVMLGLQVILMWDRWKHIIIENSIRESAPDSWEGFEYLHEQLVRLRAKKGLPEHTYEKGTKLNR